MYSSGRSKASPMDWNRNVETPSFPFPVKRKDASKLCQETPLSNTTAGMQLSNKTPTVPLSQQSSGLASMPSANLEDSTTSIEEAEKNSSSLKKSEQCTAQLKNKGPASFPAKFFASFTDLLNARNISILPYILIGYLRLVFHLTWLLTFIWGIWALYAILMNDVSIKINAETNLIIQEIEQAKMLFSQNKCFNEDVIRNSPALDSLCAGWKTKAEQSDPRSKISHGKLMAETIAEIINSFVERITLRSLIFSIIFFLVMVVFSRSLNSIIHHHNDATGPGSANQCTRCHYYSESNGAHHFAALHNIKPNYHRLPSQPPEYAQICS